MPILGAALEYGKDQLGTVEKCHKQVPSFAQHRTLLSAADVINNFDLTSAPL